MKKITCFVAGCTLSVLLLSGCGNDSVLATFKEQIDSFCDEISELDSAMNEIDGVADNAKTELLGYLDQLNEKFDKFKDMDFPEDFDYLESLADEAEQYMEEAVTYYHKLYDEAAEFNENFEEYAKENYSRAYKRVQVIISFLHGEKPQDVEVEY